MVGINPASVEAHQRFAEKLALPFPLLSDAERKAAAAYGALKENGTSIQRTVLIVDRQGRIAYRKEGMPGSEELLAALDGLDD